MTDPRLTLEECGQKGELRTLPPGEYTLEYHDASHVPSDKWIRLARLNVRPASTLPGDENAEQFFTIQKDIGDLPDKPAPKPVAGKSKIESADANVVEYERRLRTVTDTLSLALARASLLAPNLSDELLEQVRALTRESGVVIVPDTNALHNGAMHWLLQVLHQPAIWILPLVASMTTVQTRDAKLKELLRGPKTGNIKTALRSRGLVNGALGLLERNKGRCQVVEIDPSLLRYQKMGSGKETDPDQGDVLEDRLIIEGIHSVLSAMRSRTARRVVTSDVNIARILSAEGIETLFVPSIEMGEEPIDCLRFDPLAGKFVGSPLRALLWELAHAFAAVRLVQDSKPVARMECYWPGKSPTDWKFERLSCAFNLPTSTKQPPGGGGGSPNITAKSTMVPAALTNRQSLTGKSSLSKPPKGSDPASSRGLKPNKAPRIPHGKEEPASAMGPQIEAVPVAGNKKTNVAKPRTGETQAPIITILPRASFPQVLRLLGALRRLKSGNAEQIVQASTGDPITVDTARRAFEILRRVRLLESDGRIMRPTSDADLIDAALRQNDLDAVSAVFERFDPYRVLSQALRAQGGVSRAEVLPLLTGRLGPVGTYESERLPRFHVLLGQAWSNNDIFLDGSNRPTDRDATDAFEAAFASTSTVGFAKVVDLLPRFCTLTRMSPWAAKRRIERFVAQRLLSGYSFQPAAGGKPVTSDEVVVGNLDDLRVEPVVIDRLHLGESPVFTVGGPAR